METGAVADLVTRARHGDEAAWAGLVDRYLGLVHAVCGAHGLDGDAAAAVNEVVWLRLAETLHTFRGPPAVGAWIAATARHECRRRAREGRWDGEGGRDGDERGDGAPDPRLDAGLVVYERDRALLAAFDGLEPRDRRLLRVLMAEPGMDDDEVAAALDVPAGTVGTARARSLDRLRVLLGP